MNPLETIERIKFIIDEMLQNSDAENASGYEPKPLVEYDLVNYPYNHKKYLSRYKILLKAYM